MRFKMYFRSSILAFCALCLHAEPRCPGHASLVALRMVEESQMIASVQVDHKGPYDFLVDTGTQVTTLEPALAQELAISVIGTVGVSGAKTFGVYGYGYVDSISIAEKTVGRSMVVMQELGQLKGVAPQIRGVLGDNFLEQFDVLFDNRSRVLCLDGAGKMEPLLHGWRVLLAEPRRGDGMDMPFTVPLVIKANLPTQAKQGLLLRVDSGSNVLMLREAITPQMQFAINTTRLVLRRVVNGVEQRFAELSDQELWVGGHRLSGIPIVFPINSVGEGSSAREDGVIPTMAFRRVFVSTADGYASFEAW